MFSFYICRICEKQSQLIDLSMNPNYTEQYLIISNYLSYDTNDGLPQFLCRFCITQLLHFVKFKQKCEDAFKKFQNSLLLQTNVEIKTEEYYCQNDWSYVSNNSEQMEAKPKINDLNLQSITETNENYDGNLSLLTVLTYENDLGYNTNSIDSGNIIENQNSNEIHSNINDISSTQFSLFICDICETEEKKFSESMPKLELHMVTFHKMVPNLRQCEQCGSNSKWFTFDELHKHNVKPHRKPYKCRYCEKEFRQKDFLIRHRRTHHKDKRYKCEFCDKSYAKRFHLTGHIRMHTGERPFKCEECGKGFIIKQRLVEHIRTHSERRKTYKCEKCGNCFLAKFSLIEHARTHTGEKPYKCELCDKFFAYKHNLSTHTRTHSGEKPYKCEYCDKRFLRKQYLNEHTRAHTGEKPFNCQYCEKCFSYNHRLKEHLKSHFKR